MSQFLTSACNTSKNSLQYRLDSQENYTINQPVNIVFMLENLDVQPLWVLTWYTPLEGLKGRILQVICDGEEILYEGPMVKRGRPTQEDYVLIQPGESVSKEVELSSAYNLPVAAVCQVKFRGTIHDVVREESQIFGAEENYQGLEIPGNMVTFQISPP
ncbi:MAG: hypothetical protein F6K50_09270 [Moorea sp. SIO3I7]|uniref:hypothetical protein n=1 Tax=Moorena sp. SIO3I8 TaxID=2607833 RepID=UPI0013CCC69D|nr:hypothetical protein [Moorena sp. SIO3I8]NEN95711.1 hypothetical protein [Moorena sp. SIO3I7]